MSPYECEPHSFLRLQCLSVCCSQKLKATKKTGGASSLAETLLYDHSREKDISHATHPLLLTYLVFQHEFCGKCSPLRWVPRCPSSSYSPQRSFSSRDKAAKQATKKTSQFHCIRPSEMGLRMRMHCFSVCVHHAQRCRQGAVPCTRHSCKFLHHSVMAKTIQYFADAGHTKQAM